MATQKVSISKLLSESNEIAKSRHYLSPSSLFVLMLSFSMVAYPILQHSLATPQSKSHLLFPFNEDPIAFKHVGLFFLYLLTLFCLSVCAIGTVTYSIYHGFFGQPLKFIYSLMRLFSTFFCAHAIILPGLVVIRLIVFGVTRKIEYLGFKVQDDSVCWFFILLGSWVLFSLGWVYLYVDWVLAPVIVVVESSWGLEPLRRSAYLVKGNRGVVFLLLLSYYGTTWLTVFGFGSWGLIIPFGSSVHQSTLVVVVMTSGSYLLSKHLLQSLIAITILYQKCKALRGELPEEIKGDINQEYISLPLDEEKVPHVV